MFGHACSVKFEKVEHIISVEGHCILSVWSRGVIPDKSFGKVEHITSVEGTVYLSYLIIS